MWPGGQIMPPPQGAVSTHSVKMKLHVNSVWKTLLYNVQFNLADTVNTHTHTQVDGVRGLMLRPVTEGAADLFLQTSAADDQVKVLTGGVVVHLWSMSGLWTVHSWTRVGTRGTRDRDFSKTKFDPGVTITSACSSVAYVALIFNHRVWRFNHGKYSSQLTASFHFSSKYQYQCKATMNHFSKMYNCECVSLRILMKIDLFFYQMFIPLGFVRVLFMLK